MDKTQLDALPHLVSFPRSGSHWVHCVIELALNRRRVFRTETGHAAEDPITFLPANAPAAPAWVHCHSIRDRAAVVAPVVYLVRNPVDTLFSLRETRPQDRRKPDEEFVNVALGRWQAHFVRWTQSADKADAVFRYEEFIENANSAFRRIIAALNLPAYAPGALLKAAAAMTKEKIIAHGRPKFANFFGPSLISAEYAARREEFRAQYSELIYSMIDEPKTIEMFKGKR